MRAAAGPELPLEMRLSQPWQFPRIRPHRHVYVWLSPTCSSGKEDGMVADDGPASVRTASCVVLVEDDQVIGQLVGVSGARGEMFRQVPAGFFNGVNEPRRGAPFRDLCGQIVDDLLPRAIGDAIVNAFVG